MIIVNADDWGRSRKETDASHECYREGSITSVTAMVFMSDSMRAAEISRGLQIPTGLHVNFSEPFSEQHGNSNLAEQQRRLVRFLKYRRYSTILFVQPISDECVRLCFSSASG